MDTKWSQNGHEMVTDYLYRVVRRWPPTEVGPSVVVLACTLLASKMVNLKTVRAHTLVGSNPTPSARILPPFLPRSRSMPWTSKKSLGITWRTSRPLTTLEAVSPQAPAPGAPRRTSAKTSSPSLHSWMTVTPAFRSSRSGSVLRCPESPLPVVEDSVCVLGNLRLLRQESPRAAALGVFIAHVFRT